MHKVFDGAGAWYRGNLHSHTTNSDGELTPEEAARAYREAGYAFLCLTDHNLYTDYSEELSTEDFLVLPGTELSAILFDKEYHCWKQHHMNGIAFRKGENSFHHMEGIPAILRFDSWDGAEILRQMSENLRSHGCYVTYNHPVWSRVEAHEFQFGGFYDALEIFNYNTVNESGTGACVPSWDEMLRKGIPMPAVASDDNHNGSFPDNFGGYVMVWATELTPEALEDAMRQGSYYASSGPRIEQIEIDGEEIRVTCGPVERINFIAGGEVGTGTTILSKDGEPLTGGAYHYRKTDTYVRVECVDFTGKTAWSNPIFLHK